MTYPTEPPPKSEKPNQHYVPRWWLRDFAGQNGALYALNGTKAAPVDVGKIMSGDWIYTVFDEWWRPSDILEDALATIEGGASRVFRSLVVCSPSDDDWDAVIWFMALCVCRHPETMTRGHELGKAFGVYLCAVDDYPDEDAFLAAGQTSFGVDLGSDVFKLMKSITIEQREFSALTLIDMLPQDPRLPQTDALLATREVDEVLKAMDCRLLRAPGGQSYVFGDRPFPPKDLLLGFTVPMSKDLALEFSPANSTPQRLMANASAADVQSINEDQAARARAVLVGSHRAQLEALGPVPRPSL